MSFGSRRSRVGYISVVGLEREIGAKKEIVRRRRRRRLNMRLDRLSGIGSRAMFLIFSFSCTRNVSEFPLERSSEEIKASVLETARAWVYGYYQFAK